MHLAALSSLDALEECMLKQIDETAKLSRRVDELKKKNVILVAMSEVLTAENAKQSEEEDE